MQITQYAEFGGWFLALLLTTTLGGLSAQGVLRAIVRDAGADKTVVWADLLLFLGEVFIGWAGFLQQRAVARNCAGLALYVLLNIPALSAFAALGYAALVFVVVGCAAPALIRRIAPAASPDERADSHD